MASKMSWFLTTFFTILTISHLSEARVHEKKLQSAVVVGTVFCDTCFQEDFTKTSHFISGAIVAVECKYERSSKPVFREEAKTDRRGEFKVHLPFSVSKHVKKIEECSVKLISSSEPYCGVASTATSTMLHLRSREQGTHIFSAGFFTFKPLKQPNLCNQKPSIQNPNNELHSNNPDLSFPPSLQDPNTPNDLPPLRGLPQLPPLPNLPQLPPLQHLPPLPPLPNLHPLQNPTKSSVPSHDHQTKQNLLSQQKPAKSSLLCHDQQTKHTPQTFSHDQELNEGRVAEQDFFFPPNPFQPPPLIPNPFQPPPLIPNPFQPPPAPLIPNPFQPPPAPLIPNPFQPPPAPTPLIPNPFQPPPAPTPLIPNPFQPPPAPPPSPLWPFPPLIPGLTPSPPPPPPRSPLWPFPPLIPGLTPSPPPPPPPIFPFPFPPIFPIPPPRSPGPPPS